MASLSKLNILQWNCRGVSNKTHEIHKLSNQFDILLLCETFLKPEKRVNFNILKQFNIIRSDRTVNKGGGLAFVIRKNLTFSKIGSIFTREDEFETLAVSIDSSMGELLVVLVYRVPGKLTPPTYWKNFFNSIKNSGFNTVFIGGDFNCHSTLWGSSHVCPNARNLCDELDVTDLILLNNGSPTLLSRPPNPGSALDLTFVTSNLYTTSSWKVYNDTLGSDHFPIFTSLGITIPISIFASHKYNLRGIDWSLFSSELHSSIESNSNVLHTDNPISDYDQFVHLVDTTINLICPQRTTSSNTRHNSSSSKKPFVPAPWWDSKCDEAIKNRKEALKNYKKLSNYSNFLIYKKTEAIAKRTLSEARRQSFKTFCDSLDRHTPLTKVWSVIKSFKNRYTQPSSASCSADRETIEKLHSLVDELYPPTVFHDDFPVDFDNNPFLEASFTISELTTAIKSCKTKSSPGLDKIDYNIIQHFPDIALSTLLSIINRIISNGVFPSSWNNYLIFFLPKSSPGKFRPISLASCLFKISEKLIYNRLIWLIERDKILSPRQFGFRKGKSCTDCLSLLSTEIWTGLAQREITGALFLDIKGAFPSVVPNILIKDLKEIGIPESISRFIYNSIKCKNMFVKINGEVIGPRTSTVGLTQGSILSPINYSIYTRKLNTIIPADCELNEFADDLSVTCRSPDLNQIINSLQSCLNIISEFLTDRGLEVCPVKTKFIIFSNKKLNSDDPNLSLTLNEIIIKPSPTVKYLGIHFHESASSDTHFNYLCDKGRKILSVLKVLRGTWWGADPHLLLRIYDSLLRSPIDYGSQASNFKSHKNFSRLEKIRNQALRLAVGYRQSTPINVMLAECCEPPLRTRFNFLAKKYLYRVFSNSTHPLRTKLPELSRLTIDSNVKFNYPLLIAFEKSKNYSELIRSKDLDPYFEFLFEDHSFTPQIILNWGHSLQNSCNPSIDFKNLTNFNFPNHTFFFTDGSKSEVDHLAGCAFVCPSLNLTSKFKISDYSSIFSLEAFAILFCLDYIINSDLSNTVIFSDSLSVLSNLTSKNTYKTKSYIIFTIRNRLKILDNLNRPTTLVWVPGHSGIEGNEKADVAAKDATANSDLVNIPLPFSDFFCLAKKQLVDSCNSFFRDIGKNKGIHYTQLYYKSRRKPWFANFTARRLWIVSLCRARANHYNLNASLARKNYIKSGDCSHCPNTEQDLDHILWACPRFDTLRADLIKSLSRALKCSPPFSCVQFLTNPTPRVVSHIFRFLKRAKIKI